jgi:hypothetical protein
MIVCAWIGGAVAEQDDMSSVEEPKRPDDMDMTEPLGRIVELARDVLRERGLTDEQIETLLTRHRAPENLR